MRQDLARTNSRPVVVRHATAGSGGEIAVLAVGAAPVNMIVVARIAERAGLRSCTITPASAAVQIGKMRPRVLVLDGGTDNCACDGLADAILAARRASEHAEPRIVFLSTRPESVGGSRLGPLVDAVVAKPFTPDRLQPILADLCRA